MYCSKCGTKNTAGATFCAKCGAKLGKGSTDRGTKPVKTDFGGYLLALLATWFIVLVLIAYYNLVPPNNSLDANTLGYTLIAGNVAFDVIYFLAGVILFISYLSYLHGKKHNSSN